MKDKTMKEIIIEVRLIRDSLPLGSAQRNKVDKVILSIIAANNVSEIINSSAPIDLKIEEIMFMMKHLSMFSFPSGGFISRNKTAYCFKCKNEVDIKSGLRVICGKCGNLMKVRGERIIQAPSTEH